MKNEVENPFAIEDYFKMIKPKELIEDLGVEGLCLTAEEYYQRVENKGQLRKKPFSDVFSSSHILPRLGMILQGFRLSQNHVVLDFGSGTCWLSKIFFNFGCKVVCLDPSVTALKLGEEIFQNVLLSPQDRERVEFKVFNGKSIELPDCSVDRIVCFDALHHVPNLEEVLSEFARVLKPGGIIALNEPIGCHSETETSQLEMARFKVLENDLSLDYMQRFFKKNGFSSPYFKSYLSDDFFLNYRDRIRFLNFGFLKCFIVRRRVLKNLRQSMKNEAVCFFEKLGGVFDSRSTNALAGKIVCETKSLKVKAGEPFDLSVTIINTGKAVWISENEDDYGVVKIACFMQKKGFSEVEALLLTRTIRKDVASGGVYRFMIDYKPIEHGLYRLRFDILATDVVWFSQIGCRSHSLDLVVE